MMKKPARLHIASPTESIKRSNGDEYFEGGVAELIIEEGRKLMSELK